MPEYYSLVFRMCSGSLSPPQHAQHETSETEISAIFERNVETEKQLRQVKDREKAGQMRYDPALRGKSQEKVRGA